MLDLLACCSLAWLPSLRPPPRARLERTERVKSSWLLLSFPSRLSSPTHSSRQTLRHTFIVIGNRTAYASLSMPSNATSPAPDDAPASGSALDNGLLQVTYRSGHPQRPRRSVIPVEGVWPEDAPLRSDATRASHDVRLMLPLTIRYLRASSEVGLPYWAREGDIQRAIWQEVRRELQQMQRVEEPMPSIIFDSDHLDARKQGGCIDVVFSSAEVFERMRLRIRTINLEKPGKKPCAFKIGCASNTLPGNIFPFDVLRLPISSIDTEVLLNSLNHMVRDVGSAIGFGYYKVTDGIDEPPHERHDVIRAYIKLNSSSVTMPFAALASFLPSHFVWEGVPHTTVFAGRQLLKVAHHSADYPVEMADKGSDTEEAKATTSAGSCSSSSDASTREGESSNASKRKRSSK